MKNAIHWLTVDRMASFLLIIALFGVDILQANEIGSTKREVSGLTAQNTANHAESTVKLNALLTDDARIEAQLRALEQGRK